MEAAKLTFSAYLTITFLFQMTASSGWFEVNCLQGQIIAPLGENVELSCQLSPPQSAEHMEIRWFRGPYTQPIHLYSDGKDAYGKIAAQYVERTELLKESIDEGKVTLRILNVSVDDDGKYNCLFRDGEFSEQSNVEVKVTVANTQVQIIVHPSTTKGVLVECHSRGWFPQPQMEWRNNRGEIIPSTSESHAQDANKLFDMKMTLWLTHLSQNNVICYLQNPVTGQEERKSIVLSEKLFPWNTTWILMLTSVLLLLLIFIAVPSLDLHCQLKDNFASDDAACCPRSQCKAPVEKCFSFLRKMIQNNCFPGKEKTSWFSAGSKCTPFRVSIVIVFTSIGTLVPLICYLYVKQRVPVSDELFHLDVMWSEDITVILCIVFAFITMLISFIFFKITDILLLKRRN